MQSKGLESEKLSWAFWNGTHWENVNSTLSEEGVLEADTDHFSVWTITEVEEVIVPGETGEEPEAEPEETVDRQIPLPVAPIALGIFAAVYMLMRKNQ